MVDVSAVIVTWNSADLVRQCLDSIYSWTRERSLEVIVVDNGSSDRTVEIINREFPGVHLIEAGENLGFPRASNLGICVSEGRFIFLLNPDTLFRSDVASILVRFLETHPEAGAASPRILGKDGRDDLFAARELPSLPSALFVHLGLRKLFPRSSFFARAGLPKLDRTVVQSVPCLTGAALMCRSDEFKRVGLLDEQIPMYFEDLDLCARIATSGKLLYFVPDATLIHLGGRSSGKAQTRLLLFAMEKGQAPWLYFRKYRGWWASSIFSGIVLLGSLYRCFLFSVLLPMAKLNIKGLQNGFQSGLMESFALLRWSASRKTSFADRLGSFFATRRSSYSSPP